MLNVMRIELMGLRKRWYAGEAVDAEMNALAAQCAGIYNEKAKDIAKRHGLRPRLTTASKILRSAEFLR